MSLKTTYSPTVPMGGAAVYKLRPVFAYSNGYWEVYRRFQMIFWLREGVYIGGAFYGGICHGGRKFP